jgi:hypothetical protein
MAWKAEAVENVVLMLSVDLNFVGHEHRGLGGDGYYDWVNIKHFTVRPSAGPADSALDSLTKHVRFRDNYAEKDSHERDSVEIHGPYKLASISPASFEPVSAEAARETLRSFVMLYGTPAEHADRLHVMEAATSATLTAADEIYRLGVLGEAARHDWGWVVRDFTELVAIDRTAGRLSLIVAAQD